MSIYVLNIATMLGLALAIDYSLFITSRFREELDRGRTVEQAVERAVGTAGKAVLFSGVAVAIGLSGLLWFQASGLSSIGLGGAIVVLASVVYSLTFLPAILGMLGPRVNALSVAGLLRRLGLRREAEARQPKRESRWERVAHCGHAPPDRRARARCSPSCCCSARPYLRLQQGIPDATVLPAGVSSRDAWVSLQTEFRAGETTPIIILLDTAGDETSVEIDRGGRRGDRSAGGARGHRPRGGAVHRSPIRRPARSSRPTRSRSCTPRRPRRCRRTSPRRSWPCGRPTSATARSASTRSAR